ncbi:MAG: glycosyltransferase family 2 protein [Candidatus Omnitrophica bacterium]|nr:glycosyltransferase family 2 protein [Candidatus Omnitrophota bacterium]
MFKKDLISVVIVNWNKRDLLQACLQSLKAQSYRDFEIIVVDNASKDGSLELVKNYFPDVKLIMNSGNLLYSCALNQGIREACGEFILCLNNDTILDKDFLKECILAMKSDKDIGIVSGKILSADGKFIDTAGEFLSRSRKPFERGYRRKDCGQFEREEFVFGAGGVAPFYRTKMLEEIKLKEGEYFDNDYGLFYEDLDLNWRANLLGWKAYYTPKAICLHARGSSAKANIPAIRFLRKFNFCYLSCNHQLMLLRNRYSTIIKNDTLPKFFLNSPFILSCDLLIWAYLTLFKPLVIIRLFLDIKFVKIAYEKRRIIRKK